ncbi:MAG: OsmC family protein [Kiritimatiellae bacterium]|nr:OsmC family protein [Kiritimatiellia bacterium]
MWNYDIALEWKDGKAGELGAAGKPAVTVATPPEFGGPPGTWTPEDLLAASVAGCVMTTALFWTDRLKVNLRRYRSSATARMEKTREGLAITAVEIRVAASVAAPSTAADMAKVMNLAEQNCPISKSLKCPVTVALECEVE